MIAQQHIARLGMVNFINTAPLYEIWRRSVKRPEWEVTEAAPSILNQMLNKGDLDLGFISSHEYALHPEKYKILKDLSISATGPVGSVYLFSHCEPEELTGKKILLTDQSQTSAYLVRILLEEFLGAKPDYINGSIETAATNLYAFSAVLAIGDEALRLKSSGIFSVQLDLSSLWHENTNLPFVFAVWAVREEYCTRYPDTVAEIHLELQRCINEGRKNLLDISKLVASRIPMPPHECFQYLQSIEYDLGEEKQHGLNLFCEYLAKRGEGSNKATPLKIYG